MDQALRNKLRSVVTQCRRLLEESIAQQLQGRYDIYATGKKDEVKAEDGVPLGHLSEEERQARQDILAHFKHIDSLVHKPKESLEQLIREIAFTHLNRLCAYKMMEVRDVYVGGQRFRESVSKGLKSQGFLFYLADHPEDEKRYNAGDQETAYRHFLNWLGGTLSQEIGVLFSPTDPANRVYPPQRVLDEALDLLNSEELKGIWSEDETIGWVYQYFTPKELRDQARKESQAPRNSYELAFRNQFFTPRYVVEFLTDNTLGRIWYEMRKGNTRLKDECRYLVRRPTEVFLRDPEKPLATPPRAEWVKAAARGDFSQMPDKPTIDDLSDFSLIHDGYALAESQGLGDGIDWADRQLEVFRKRGELPRSSVELWLLLFRHQRNWGRSDHRESSEDEEWLSVYRALREVLNDRGKSFTQEELLRQAVYVAHRPKKDPREIKILDPACGSGHFLLYCFALLLVIYEEAFYDPDLGPGLQADYPTKADLQRAVPGLILRHNLHGIDIDLRCSQIAALALWLRCQRAYQEAGLKKDRPPILKANVVCAEPMPGEKALLEEFLKTLREDRLEALIRQVLNVPKGQRVRATKGMAESLADLVHTVWDRMRLAGEAGSLLKIEEELQEAVRKGQDEWEERMPLFRFTEYGLSEEPKEQLVRFVPGDVEGERFTFWDKAESLVRRALDEFISFASNAGRLQRQLFVEDAQQGLGFVDVCRQTQDVVLMNPPFGEPSKQSKGYIDRAYRRTKNDVYAAFVERGLGLLNQGGTLGAITSRTGFFLSSFTKWREEILLEDAHPFVFADLGFGVLDSAKVETAAYCLSASCQDQASAFFRLLGESDLPESLLQSVRSLGDGRADSIYFLAESDSFRQVPGSPFAYWVSETTRRLFKILPPFENDHRTVKQGLATADDFRFVRAWWEVSPDTLLTGSEDTTRNEFVKATTLGKHWVPIVKGGVNTPFHGDILLVVNWKDDGNELKEFDGSVIRNPDYYFQAGLTWPARPWLRGFFSFVPAGTIFSHTGMMVFVSEEDRVAVCGLLNSDSYAGLLHLLMARGIGVETDQTLKYEAGYISSVPIPALDKSARQRLEKLAFDCHERVRSLDVVRETSHYFHAIPVAESREETLSEIGRTWSQQESGAWSAIGECRKQLNMLSFELYGINADDRSFLEEGLDKRTAPSASKAEISSDYGEEDLIDTAIAPDTISYCMGCVLARWDIRIATGEKAPNQIAGAFSPLPATSAGMLRCEYGSPVPAYSLRISGDGILVDDPDHTDDIIRRVRDVLEVIWKVRADAIEKEACEILGVADLRDYFRKPGAGGFWDDHIKRYSKSRRKAPIYWLLQSSKKNYALWIYYHRLDKDILFKALLNYVEPKIRREETRLDGLRSQKTTLGPAAKGAKKIDKDIDRQEAFLTELRDFEEKLRRAANLHLEPDLNDGVVLNIAPLRELVPWKEARAYWDDLMDGKYEWSSIGKQLREQGLVR